MTRPLYTEADLYLQGPALRLRDIMAITGCSRWTLYREMDRGELVGRRIRGAGSAWLFDRPHVKEWWEAKVGSGLSSNRNAYVALRPWVRP